MPIIGPWFQDHFAWRQRDRLAGEVYRRLHDAVQEWHPDLVLFILVWGEVASTALLQGVGRVPMAGWLMDDPFLHDGSLARALSAFDRLYAVEESWANNIRLATGKPARLLTCGVDPEAYHEVPAGEVPSEFRGDIVFIGSSYRDNPAWVLRGNLLDRIADLDLSIYGDQGWVRHGGDERGSLARAFRGRELPAPEANLAYNGARIVLNIHHPQFHQGTSLRTFAISAAGAFQLADERPGLGRFLVPGKEVVTYSSPDDLRDKALYYLKHDAARQSIAQAGFQRVRAEHTYAHRLAEILIDAGLPVPVPPGTRLPATASRIDGERMPCHPFVPAKVT